MNLVVGATGLLGGEICALLRGAGRPVRALVRPSSDPSRVATLEVLGAEVVVGDLRTPSTLLAACRGVTTVVSTASSVPFAYEPGANTPEGTDAAGVLALVEAARLAGVPRFVYTSFSSNIDTDFPLRNAKRKVERALRESGLAYTILRPSYFMETWLNPAMGFDPIAAKATVYGSGASAISWISLSDVARLAVISLENRAALGATLELGGPQALSPLEVVRIFEEVGGRQFEVRHVPESALEAQLDAATDPLERSFAGLKLCYARGDAIDARAKLDGMPLRLTSVRDYATRALYPLAAGAI